jgi:hypothetical protein
MKRTRKLGSLTTDDTQELLGAASPTSIRKLPTNPLGLRMAASRVQERLVSRGGRPSDPAWTIVRKVPMRPETWAELNRYAQALQEQNVRVSAGQVAAIALERGLEIVTNRVNFGQRRMNDSHSFSPDARVSARIAICALSQGGGLFKCA